MPRRAGLKGFEFTFDPNSLTIPPGWFLNGPGNPDLAWQAVMTNVTSITFFYGDPTFFFIFDIWNVGADNLRISAEPVWTNLGGGLAGAGGTPALAGEGQLVSGSQTKIAKLRPAPRPRRRHTAASSTQRPLPFKGGVVAPDAGRPGRPATSPAGAITLTTPWPAGPVRHVAVDADVGHGRGRGPKAGLRGQRGEGDHAVVG